MDDAGPTGSGCSDCCVFSDDLHTDASGQASHRLYRDFFIILTPDLEGLTVQRFLQILLDAMSQLFFSLSVSMGIMITYGSYVKPEVNLNKAINQIEIFDTGVAFLAGAMIIPAGYMCFPALREWVPDQA